MQKLKPENLVASARSPVIPDVSQAEKVEIAKEREEKAKLKAERKAERLTKEKVDAEGEKAPEPKKEPVHKREPKGLKPKKEPKSQKPLEFPVSARINNYGFLGFRKGLLEALDWHKGMGLKIEKNADGSVTVRKA